MTENVIIAVVAALLGAPFLNFLLSLTRNRADRDNVIATGAGTTVKAMQDAVTGLRNELNEVREDLASARRELDQQQQHHRTEIENIRAEHREEIKAIRAEHQRQMAELEARLTGETGHVSN